MYAKKIVAHTQFEEGSKDKIDVSSSRVCQLDVGPAGYLASAGFDGKLRQMMEGVADFSHPYPDAGLVYDYYFDPEERGGVWLPWMKKAQPYVSHDRHVST